jgi:anti-sigma B factor antagonist
MTVESSKLENAVLIKVSGRLDAENTGRFEQACTSGLETGTSHLIVDVSELEYVSSMGLRSFLSAAQALQKKGGAMMLCGLHGLPKQVFEMTRLIGLFPLHDSTEKAVAAISHG